MPRAEEERGVLDLLEGPPVPGPREDWRREEEVEGGRVAFRRRRLLAASAREEELDGRWMVEAWWR